MTTVSDHPPVTVLREHGTRLPTSGIEGRLAWLWLRVRPVNLVIAILVALLGLVALYPDFGGLAASAIVIVGFLPYGLGVRGTSAKLACLVADGKLTRAEIDADAAVDLVRCGDVTGDGVTEGLFPVASGGTAGDIRFGVYRGGARPKLVLWEQGYKVGVARASARAFEVLQPHYKDDEPNCCPSSFRVRRYTWNGRHFHAGKVKKLKKVPPRFFQ